MAAASARLSYRKLHCIEIAYVAASSPSPACIIARHVGCELPLAGVADEVQPVAQLEQWLDERGIVVFCVVDELQNAFTAACSHGETIIRELASFGNSTRGVIHWVLTGSSSDLSSLVTARWQGPEGMYPQYHGLDLNDKKFVPLTIFPFLEANHFVGLVDFWCTRLNEGPLSDGDISRLYLQTGGLPRPVADDIEVTVYSPSGTGIDSPPTRPYTLSAKGFGA